MRYNLKGIEDKILELHIVDENHKVIKIIYGNDCIKFLRREKLKKIKCQERWNQHQKKHKPNL